MKRHPGKTTSVRDRKSKTAMDYNLTPTISTDYLHEQEGEDSGTVRATAKLDEEKMLPTSGMNKNASSSLESLNSAADVGCSRILGDIQAGLQADIIAAKVF